MGRKQRNLCCSMKLLAMVPVLIVLAPAWLFTPDTYLALIKTLRSGKGIETADTLFVNATIWTGETRQPWAHSMAVAKGRILSIGESQTVAIGPDTKVVDLEGKFVAPGFIDSHVHFLSGGLQMTYVQLDNVRSRADFTSKLRLVAQETKKGKWIFGANWNHANWGGEMPDASWIDAPDNPVLACRLDAHTCVANPVALAIAGIHHDTPDPEGGTFGRDSQGDPTGLLLDMAITFMAQSFPKPSVEERREAFTKASKLALSNGVTSVIDFGRIMGAPELQWDDLNEVYLWADAAGIMLVRVSAYLPIAIWPTVAAFVQQKGHDVSQWLRVSGVKAFADGSLGSGTALFHQAYADNNTNFGLQVVDPDWLLEAVLGADKAGLQVAVHAIGDAANDQVLSMFEAVESTNGPRDRRFRLEHAQHLSAGAPKRCGTLGVIASMQPDHIRDDAHYAAKRLGEERAELSSYLIKSLLGNGTLLALGSDWTVAPLDPLLGIEAAATRIPKGETAGWIPGERISRADALRGFTWGSAYASFRDAHVGTLWPTKFADFVILSQNPLLDHQSTTPAVVATYVAGVRAYPTSEAQRNKS